MNELSASTISTPPPASRVPRPAAIARRIAGLGMRQSDEELYRRSIGLLTLQLEDVVLEIGCGVGIGVEQAAEIAALGKVCGIEADDGLLASARSRNADAIDSDYVELQQGLASRLPWPDTTFTAAFAVNSPRDWPQPVANLNEISRVMRPGGRLAIVIQTPWRTRREHVRDLAELWAHRLNEAGFHDVRYGILSASRGGAAATTGTA